MNETRYPLQWPVGVPRAKNRSSNYTWKQPFDRIRDDLAQELERLGADGIIVSTNASVTAYGMPRGSDNPSDPGVAVYFTRKGKRLCFACDRWYTVRENMKAIAMSVEAIRGLERWGASDMVDRAFTGFAALPESRVRHWRQVFGCGAAAVDAGWIEEEFRKLASERHPDRQGGSHEAMSELNAARTSALAELRK